MQKNFNPVVSNLDFVCTNCKNLQFLYYRLHEMQKKNQENVGANSKLGPRTQQNRGKIANMLRAVLLN